MTEKVTEKCYVSLEHASCCPIIMCVKRSLSTRRPREVTYPDRSSELLPWVFSRTGKDWKEYTGSSMPVEIANPWRIKVENKYLFTIKNSRMTWMKKPELWCNESFSNKENEILLKMLWLGKYATVLNNANSLRRNEKPQSKLHWVNQLHRT
jgi:hypothetical protein